jgi:hypothetical protein
MTLSLPWPVMDPEDASYVCSLDAASIKKARDELNELPEDRLAAVKALRDWIKTQPHLRAKTGEIKRTHVHALTRTHTHRRTQRHITNQEAAACG